MLHSSNTTEVYPANVVYTDSFIRRLQSVRTGKQAVAMLLCEELTRVASLTKRCVDIARSPWSDEEMASVPQRLERLLSDTNSIVSNLEEMT
jgi:hypothetical protein